MTMVVKQGFRSWSSPDPNFLSNFPISSLKTRKFLKPTSPFFAIFAGLKGTSQNASNIISCMRKDSKNGESQQSSLCIFNFKERMISRFPLAVLAAHAIMFHKPLLVLAETCEADNSILNMNMPLLLFVALIGATVGGLVARKRKGELQQLNEQLRQINESLRRQAKIESYAPSLSYAPVSGKLTEDEVIVDPRKPDLISRLKNGKRFLRNQEPEKAFAEFKSALELAQNLKDSIEEKKAARGVGENTIKTPSSGLSCPCNNQLNKQLRQINESLRRQAKIESYAPSLSYAPVSDKLTEDEGKRFLRNQEPEKAFAEFKSALELAQNLKDPIEEKKGCKRRASLQRQGKYQDAIKYHTLVLEISQYGAIADCYTELGDLERTAKYYDQYIL
ncbi:tetratricopeptide repeat protein, partial [Striga asiatica]